MSKPRSPKTSRRQKFIEFYLEEKDGYYTFFSSVHPALGNLTEAEQTRLNVSLEAVGSILGVFFIRFVEETLGGKVGVKEARWN